MSRLFAFGLAAFIVSLVGVSSLSAQQDIYALAASESVQKELGVTDEQKTKLRALKEEEFEYAIQIAKEYLPALLNSSFEERAKANAAKEKKLNDKFLPGLKEILKPEQFDRLMQIFYQAQKAGIYTRPDVVSAIDLTKDQQARIAAINGDFQKKLQPLNARNSSYQADVAKLIEEKDGDLAKVLTAQQSEKLSQLKGKPFDFPVRPPLVTRFTDEKKAKTDRLSKLLENLHVLNELKVGDEVYARLKELQQEERLQTTRFGDEIRRESQATSQLSFGEQDERRRAFFPAYQARRDAAREEIASNRFKLLTGPQMERLDQIDFQDQGLDVFLADDVIKGLKLTAEERRKLDEIYDTYVAKIKPLLPFGLYREVTAVRSTKPEVVALVKERAAKTDELLGKERAEKIAELRGKPFDVSQLELMIGRLPIREQTIPRASEMLLDLVHYEAVRKDLKLTPEEEGAIAAANAKAEKTWEEVQQRATGQLPRQELSAVQRALQTLEETNGYQQKRDQIRQDYQAELGKIIKESHLKRLEQINLQKDWSSLRRVGFGGFGGLGGKNELGLTPDQAEKMRSIESDFRQKKSALLGGDARGRIERRRELTRQEENQYLEVLTPEQRQKLKELQGLPFDISAFDPLAAFSPLPAIANRQDPLETKFDQSVIDYVNGTLLREQDTNGDGSLDKSEWVKGKWSAANPPENSDLNKDGKLSREELCIRISKTRGIPIKGEQPQPLPDSSK
jgi:hypothetical protein